MDRTETVERNDKVNYIKPYVLFNYGKEIAAVLAKAYSSSSAKEKLDSVEAIIKCNLKEEAKIKFIGDIMIRPKKERFAIARKLFKMLEEGNERSN